MPKLRCYAEAKVAPSLLGRSSIGGALLSESRGCWIVASRPSQSFGPLAQLDRAEGYEPSDGVRVAYGSPLWRYSSDVLERFSPKEQATG